VVVDGFAVSYCRLKQLLTCGYYRRSLLSDVGHCSPSAAQACMASAAFTSFIRQDRGFCKWIPRR
jgi:hypothetical protein